MPKPQGEPGLICFLLPLPEPIGFPHHNIYEFEEGIEVSTDNPVPVFLSPGSPPMPGRSSAGVSTSLKIWQYTSSTARLSEQMDAVRAVFAAITGVQPEPSAELDLKTSITVIEAVTRLLKPTAVGVMEAFDRCLTRIDNLTRAYGLATGHAVAPVTKQRMADLVIFMTKDLLATSWSTSSILTLGFNEVRRYVPPDLQEDTQLRMMEFVAQAPMIDPVLSYLELSAESMRAYDREGDMRMAVINAETACEVFLDGVLQAMLWEEGTSPDDARDLCFNPNWTLARRIKSSETYASRLGGCHWKLGGSGPVANWYNNVAALRNRCVHAGYRPTSEETERAIKSKKELGNFIAARLKQKRRTFPRTASIYTNTAPRLPSLQNDRKELSGWLAEFRLSTTAGGD